MDLQRAGGTFRAVRIRRGWRQIDVARRAGVARTTASRIERGHADELSLRTLEQVARALDIRLDLLARWRGGDLDRLLSAGHSALAGTVSELLTRTGDWQVAHEVTFGVYGERGAIDILAWHASSRALLVVELKTEIVDVGALVGQVDRYRRLAPGVARERGWQASVFGCWVVVAEGPTNRRHVTTHRALLRNAFPDDRRSIRT